MERIRSCRVRLTPFHVLVRPKNDPNDQDNDQQNPGDCAQVTLPVTKAKAATFGIVIRGTDIKVIPATPRHIARSNKVSVKSSLPKPSALTIHK